MKHTFITLLILLAVNIAFAQDSFWDAPSNLYGGPEANDNGVVGAIGGTVDVSALGGATYTIPIQVPEGINGIQPNLSIVYNSQSGDGLLGWGWNLEGLSVITRTRVSEYYDGSVNGIDLTGKEFALDGQRLLPVNYYYNDSIEFRTEVDGMTKIVAYYKESSLKVWYFKVWFSDGTIAYYGNSTDSKVMLQEEDNVCVWLLKRLEDRDGNYMTYHYNTGGAHYYLETIKYTGNSNAGFGPMFIVNFNYEPRSSENVEMSFIGKNDLKMNVLLKSIEIKKWKKEDYIPVLIKYNFKHFARKDSNGSFGRYIYDRLDTIKCSYFDNSFNPAKEYAYNPTVIEYGTYPDIFNGNTNPPFTEGYKTAICTSNSNYLSNQKFVGDLNGDGLSDMITPHNEDTKSYVCLYFNKGNTKSIYQPGTIDFDVQEILVCDKLHPKITWIYVCDFNGDGLDDFLVFYQEDNSIAYFKVFKAYKSKIDENGVYQAECVGYYNCGPGQTPSGVYIGDFMGRGKDDIIVEINSGFQGNDYPFRYYEYVEENGIGTMKCTIADQNLHPGIPDWKIPYFRYTTGDFDGDGKTEIWAAAENGEGYFYKIQCNGDSYYQWAFKTFSNYLLTPFAGDFNGDGITDLLMNAGNNWYIKLCASPDTYGWYEYNVNQEMITLAACETPYFSYNIEDRLNNTTYYIDIADMNGDGKSDVVILNKYGELHILYGPIISGNRENNTNFGHFTYKEMFDASLAGLGNGTSTYSAKCVGNFLGEDNLSILDATVFSLPSLSTYYGLKSITDGMGNTTEFDFGYLVNNPHENAENIYTLTKNCENNGNDIYAVSLPIKAVKKLTSYNKHDEKPVKSISEYTYSGILLHRKGKGLLGLSANTVESYLEFAPYHDYTGRTYNTTAMGRHCAVTPSTEKTFLKKRDTGTLLRTSETEFEYDKHVHSHNDLVYMPLLTSQITDLYDIDILRNGEPSFLKRTISKTETTFSSDIIESKSIWDGTSTDNTIREPRLCDFYSEKYLYYDVNVNLWLVNNVSNIDETKVQNEEEMLLYEDIIYYDDDNGKPHRIKKIAHYPWQWYSSQYATKTEYTYNEIGKVETEVLSAINDPDMPERKTEYIYNGWRQLNTKREWLDGNIYYDTKFEYDPFFEFVTAETNCRGQKTKYERDPLGIDRITHFPDGTMTHTQTGWLDGKPGYYEWSQSSGNAPVMSYYDLKGVKQKTETCGFSSSQLITKNYNHNDLGLLESEGDPHLNNESEQLTKYNYDNYGRLFKTVFPNGTSQETVPDAENGFKTKTILHTPNEGEHETWQETNALGWTTCNWDEKGIPVSYEYYADGLLKTATVNNDPNTTIWMEYDESRNRTKLHDPDYCGPNEDKYIENTYDAYGQLKTTTTPKGDVTIYEYDGFGRTTMRIEENHTTGQKDITNYVYFNNGGFKGLLKEINFNGDQEITEYAYFDDTRKLNKVTETINGSRHSPTIYHYNENGMADRIKYPSGFEVQKEYTNTGHLKIIRDAKENRLWETKEKNGQGQITDFTVGNGSAPLNGHYQYYPKTHYIESQKITNSNGDLVQHFGYHYYEFGNLEYRNTDKYPIREDFLYDELNRLTISTVSYNGQTYTSKMTYDEPNQNGTSQLGCMTQKTAAWEGMPSFDIANYGENGRPHSLIKANMSCSLFPTDKQETEYTAFDKLSRITQYDDNGNTDLSLAYTYGHGQQRIAMTEENGGTMIRRKTYIGNCEYIKEGGIERSLTYLTGPLGVFAVYEQMSDIREGEDKGGSRKLHYLLTDHLGSITTIVNTDGIVEQELSYDAWGNLRDPQTWCSSFKGKPMFDRGFTGHEHLYDFGLINMNGRMYDPVMNTFLSVDNYVSSPDFPQAFNRYAYCLYNPLKYTDPDGEFPFVPMLIGAGISVVTNGINNSINHRPLFEGVGKAALLGGVQGLCSFGIGQVASSIASTAGRIAFQTVAHGALGAVSTSVNGGTFAQGFVSGAASSLVATGMGGLTQDMGKLGQAIGTVGGGALAGGVGSSLCGGSFWDGFRNGAISSGLNHAIHIGALGKGLMMASITGRTRHLFMPDAIAAAATLDASAGIAMGIEAGGITILVGKDKGFKPYEDLGMGAGGITASLGVELVSLYSSSATSEVGFDDFSGPRWEGNFSVTAFDVNVGGTATFSKHYDEHDNWNGEYTIGIGVSLGVDAMPFNANLNINYGASNVGNLNGLKEYLRSAFNIRRP